MKIFLLVSALLLCASIFATVHFYANERILRVGIECDYPPNNWEEERMTEYAILVQKDGKWANAKKLTDFAGARFVGKEDSNFDEAIEQITGAIHLPPVATASKMLEKLLKNEAYGIITDVELIDSYVKNNPSLTGIKLPTK